MSATRLWLVSLAAGLLGVSGCVCDESAPSGCCGSGGTATAAPGDESCCPAVDPATGTPDCCAAKSGPTAKAGLCPECAVGEAANSTDDQKGAAGVPPVLNFKMDSLDGKPVDLSKYQGKVAVFVNVASKCGYTPQYKSLQALHDKYAARGVAVLGFPANEFGKQEPGTNAEIATFCQQNYGVQFDMFAKIVVKGPGQCDLYKYLTSKETNPKFAGDIKWNFEKFIVGRNGQVVARFASNVKPDSEELLKVIEAELAKP